MTETARSRTKDHSETASRDSVVILIESRSLTRQCLSAWLEQREFELELRALGTPLAALDHEAADVALVIWSIGASSISSERIVTDLKRLRRDYPSVPLAVLADREDPADIREAISCGVNGYVPTSLDDQLALEVLRFVRAGGTYVPASALIDADKAPERDDPRCADQRSADTFHGLTPREAEVVERLRQGKPNKIIAHELEISESTVKVFVHRILHKLGAVNRTEVAYLAQKHQADRTETGTHSDPVA